MNKHFFKMFFLLLSMGFSLHCTPAESEPAESKSEVEAEEVSYKMYITSQEFLEDSFALARQVFDSGYRPDFLVALWRGGAPIGLAVTEFFDYKNAPIEEHLSVRTSAYANKQLQDTVQVFDLDYLVNNLQADSNLLIVDDVVDSGKTIDKFRTELQERCGDRFPKNIKVAAVYYKPEADLFSNPPDFYIHTTDEWIIFPHSVEGLDIDEIRSLHGEEIAEVLSE